MSQNLFEITDDSFESEVLNSEKPVLVDFWATWCGPCRAIAPVVEAISVEYEDKLKVCKVDVEKNSKVGADFGIQGIPALLLFKGGKVIDTHVGVTTKPQLAAFLDKHL